MVIHLKTSEIEHKNPVYYVTFEEYLKPKTTRINKTTKQLILNNNKNLKKPALRLKLLEHPVLITGQNSKWHKYKEKFYNIFKSAKESSKLKRTYNTSKNNKIFKFATIWRNKTFKVPSSRFSYANIKLPCCLAFLKARNDDGLCKPKSGFEIYCEMASIHGFRNFVGATTWQRALWCFVVFLAVTMSAFILVLSHLMNSNTPTILYTKSTQYPIWSVPFPAVTICNINRISKRKAMGLAERFHKTTNLTVNALTDLFRLALFTAKDIKASADDYRILTEVLLINNYTLYQLLDHLTPNCENELLRCKWKGRFERCDHLFKKVSTPFGECCAFNNYALKKNLNKGTCDLSNNDLEYTFNCGYKMGLTVLLDSDLEDYKAALFQIPGYQVLIHDPYELADATALKRIITPTSVNKISITAQKTQSTDYINSEAIKSRRCYLPQERQLFYFRSYTQTNCLAECRSAMLYEKCHCTLPTWAKKENWTVCGLQDQQCITNNKDIFYAILKFLKPNEQFICDCYPLCDFNRYIITMDSGKLDRRFSLTDKRFFKDINITNQILLHIYYDELYGEYLGLDVFENWLSFIGTFGGITGLYMGYSFVSGCELIFFVFVRPACNWLTKKQIKYRIQRRKKKQQVEQEKKRKLEMEQEKQERIEAYLRMRPYCPGY